MQTSRSKQPSQSLAHGLVGLGVMGRGLARNLAGSGLKLHVFDTDSAALERAARLGAEPTASLSDLLDRAQIVMTCLPSLAVVDDVLMATVDRARPGQIICDFSTSNPARTRYFSQVLAGKGADLIDCPMLRNHEAAWEGRLVLLVGGAQRAIEAARPALEAVSERIVLTGETGSAHTIKVLNNAVTVANGTVLAEVFAVARRMGADFSVLSDVMGSSFAASAKLGATAPRLISDDHAPGFAVDMALKDIALFTQIADETGVPTPVADSARDLLRQTSAMGYGSEHDTRVVTALERLMGTDITVEEAG